MRLGERNITQRRRDAKRIKPKLYKMDENYLAKVIVNTCYNIHVKLGPGNLEGQKDGYWIQGRFNCGK